MLAWIILGLVGPILVAMMLLRRRRPESYPPGPLSLPIIGNLHQMGVCPHEEFMKMKAKYGNIMAIDFGGFRGVVLNDYKVIREALNIPEFNGRPLFYAFVARCGGDRLRGIVFNTGTSWLEQRRFTLKTLRDFGFGTKSLESLIQLEITELIQSLSRLNGKPMTTKALFNLAIVNAIWSITTGKRYSHDDKKLGQLVKIIVDAISDLPAVGAFLFFPWLCKIAPNLSGFNSFVGFNAKIAELVKEQMDKHKATIKLGQPRDFLDSYIQQIMKTKDPNSSFFESEGERNLCITLLDLFGAAVETTGTSLSWLFVYLSIDKRIQDKFSREIDDVVGVSRLPSLNDRQNMPYTEAIMVEVLRISSLVPLSLFHETTETVSFHGYVIPKNTLIIPNTYGANYDPEVWGDPGVFCPERFINAEDGSINRHHDAFLPFSVGKRVSLGESLARDEFFLFSTSIFQNFSVEPTPGKPRPNPAELSGGFVRMLKVWEYTLHERH